ncbi:MAG: hypothetical protein ACXW4B_10410 [Micavibrio sp.]
MKLPWTDKKAAKPALPAPPPERPDPLKIDFKIAAFGRKFRTATFANIRKVDGEVEWMAAVAIQPDQWRVTKVTANPAMPDTGHQVRVVHDKVTFKIAAEKLLAYEATAPHLNLVKLDHDKDALGFAHVENFCLREGLVPDMDGKLHPLVAGEIVTSGRFESDSVEKAVALLQKIPLGELDLPQAWNQTYLRDMFQKYDPDLTWGEIDIDLKELEKLEDVVFRAKSGTTLIHFLNDVDQDEGKIAVADFIAQTKYGRSWKDSWVSLKLKEKNLCSGLMSENVRFAEDLKIPEPMKQEVEMFFRDFYIFDLTRRSRLRIQKGAENIRDQDRNLIAGGLERIRGLMAKNGYAPDVIAKAETAILNPEPLESIPPEIERQIDRFEAVYIAMRDRINQKLGQDEKPAPPQPEGPQPG